MSGRVSRPVSAALRIVSSNFTEPTSRDGDPVPYSITGSLHIEAIFRPLHGVTLNIIPNLLIIPFIPYHMVMKGALKKSDSRSFHVFIDPFCYIVFIPPYNCSQRRGRVSRPAMSVNRQQYMYVIRHHHIMIDLYLRIFYRDLPNQRLRNNTRWFWDGKPVPYNLTKGLSAPFRTNRHKICTRRTVIVFFQPVRFSFRMIHSSITICKTRGAQPLPTLYITF